MGSDSKFALVIREVLQDIADLTPDTEALRTELVCDERLGHFHLGEIGWDGNERIDIILIHIDIIDGKVWLQYNGTDLRVAEELIRAGVPRENIILGFQPPQYRKYTDYAAA